MMWLLLLLPSAGAALPFVTTWNISSGPPFRLFYAHLWGLTTLSIDWGDGSNSTFYVGTTFTNITHDYPNAGLFNVSLFGMFDWQNPNPGLPKPQLIDIVSWGDGFMVGTSCCHFSSYTNLRVSADPNTQPVFASRLYNGYRTTARSMFNATSFDSPLNWNMTNVKDLGGMFANTPLNKPITFTNTQTVMDMSNMFQDASKFNQPVSLDCSSCQSLAGMFGGASAFNSPLNLTNTTQVTFTSFMFYGASSFNQPLALDTGSVTDMTSMFSGASRFNQSVNFNTSLVRYMYGMFENASNFVGPVNFTSTSRSQSMASMFSGVPWFEQDVSGWDTEHVTSCSRFCLYCPLPPFKNCTPCTPRLTNANNQSVCSTTPAPSVPTTQAPTNAPTLAPSTRAPSASSTRAPSPSASSTRAPSAATQSPSTGASSTQAPSASPTATRGMAVSAARGAAEFPLLLLLAPLLMGTL